MNAKSIFGVAAAMLLSTTASAAVVELEGNFIYTAVGDNGTLGVGDNGQPGLQLDPTGTGNFDPLSDFISPGIPFEAFVFQSDQSGIISNDNDDITFGFAETVPTTDLSGVGFDNRATWAGANTFASVELDTRFNDNSKSIEIVTTITALQTLSNVYFGRQIDPDPNNVPGGTASTVNFRGLDANGDGDFDDPGDLGPTKLVGASGSGVGETLVLYTFETSIPTDTGIDTECCTVQPPSDYFGGNDFPAGSEGDDGLGLSFFLGDLIAGQSLTFTYYYGVAAERGGIVINPNPVPAPGALGLLGLGLLGAVALRRRKTA